MENENKSSFVRMILCIAITVLIFSVFLLRLFNWQIIQSPKYKEISQTSTSYTVMSEETRGEIFDCNGKPLVTNKTSYDVILDKLYIESKNQNEIIIKLLALFEENDGKWIDTLPITVASDGSFSLVEGHEDEIEYIKDEMLSLGVFTTTEDYIESFKKRYEITDELDNYTLRNLISVRYNMELEGFDYQTPYVFAEQISDKMVAVVSENMQDYPSVEVKTTLNRTVDNGTLMPHILGNVGAINEDEYEALKDSGYELNDSVGKFGVESALEAHLKGVEGSKTVMRNSSGTVVDVIEEVAAQPGHSVFLTVDSELQKIANKSLEENVKAAKKAGEESVEQAKWLGEEKQSLLGEDCETGAVVMLDVDDFSVLCASSYPSFDLSKYSDYDYYMSLISNENTPLYNRAFNGSFAPGSVFKPLVAMAALEEGVIKSTTEIDCTRKYDYFPKDPVYCMGRHGEIALHSALVQSCNYYFAETGRLLGIDSMYLYAEKFALGTPTGIEVSESQGVLAGRDSEVWTQGNTVQAAIGQSDNTFTPLQLATYTATIANDGVRLKTHIVSKITDYNKTTVIKENKSDNPTVMNESSISPENIKKVQHAMYDVVHNEDGTAYSSFQGFSVPVAAKTGTAENAGSDHAVFICYAPYDNPQVALAVVLENGAKGKYAMNVAKDLLTAYFK